MRPKLFADIIAFDEALRRVLAAAVPIDRTETVALAAADGRVAAEDVKTPFDVPPFDRAAMDGYAVVASDTAGASDAAPRRLRCTGRVFSGERAGQPVGPGECVEIATGAPMPPGATAVVMVERTSRSGDEVDVFAPVEDRQNVGRRGADMAQDAVVVRAGDLLTPARVGALAATGAVSVRVYAQPSLAVLSTGDEVVEPGSPLAPGQIYDINRFTLGAVARRHGGATTMIPVAGDSLGALDAALDAVSAHDIAVFSGGSSVGGRDLLRDALSARGEIVFHGMAVKPGKPTLFGRIGRTLVFGMPGYPASCLSNAYLLLVPLLRATARLPAWRPETITAPLARAIVSTADRHQFYTVRVRNGLVEPAFKSSGDITSMAEADGYVQVPVGISAIEKGTEVTVTNF